MIFAVRLERGGPWEWSRGLRESAAAVRERLAQDNWARNGMLTIKSVEAWTILLDGRAA